MKISLYSATTWNRIGGLQKAIELAKECGYDAIDIRELNLEIPGSATEWRTFFGYDQIAPENLDKRERETLRKIVEDRGLFVSALTTDVLITHSNRQALKENIRLSKNSVDLARDIGSKFVRCWNSTLLPGVREETAYRNMIEFLKYTTEYAEKQGITLLIETHNDAVLNSAQKCMDAICRVGTDNLMVVLDFANLYMEQSESPDKAIETVAKRLGTVHAKNVRKLKGGKIIRGLAYEYTALSDGEMDWVAIIRLLEEAGYQGVVLDENETHYYGSPPPMVETISKNAAFLRKHIKEAK